MAYVLISCEYKLANQDFTNYLAMVTDGYCNENTVSGLHTLKKFIGAYLYKRRMIIREKIIPPCNNSDIESPPGNQSQGRRLQASNNENIMHQVRCCHCPPSVPIWGLYAPTNTTTSVFLRHFEKFHQDLPRSQEQKDDMVC